MIAAHMDEIGVIVSHVDENGFARFHNIGGVFPHTLVGHRVRFEGNITGVIGVEAAVTTAKAPTEPSKQTAQETAKDTAED